jgi:hypothetical protein
MIANNYHIQVHSSTNVVICQYDNSVACFKLDSLLNQSSFDFQSKDKLLF